MKKIVLTKNEMKTKNIILIISSLLILLLGISFFLNKYIVFIDGNEIFYVVMLLYFGIEFSTYILTRTTTGLNFLYISLAALIASVSGLLYMKESSNLVLSLTLLGWIIIMTIIKLINIEELHNEGNYCVFINLFTMSLFILLGILTITNLYKGLINECMMLGFFFTVNGILNIVDVIGNIKFCRN